MAGKTNLEKSLFVRVSLDMHATTITLSDNAGYEFVSDYIRDLIKDQAISAGMAWDESEIAAARDVGRMLEARGIKRDGGKTSGKGKVPDKKSRGKAAKG